MKINEQGIGLIKRFEGLRLQSYQDVAGHWTIGYGHTGPEVVEGLTYTLDKANETLNKDIKLFDALVERLAPNANENEHSAFVSLAFNIGANAFEKSTALRLHVRGDDAGAADAITFWNKATVNGVKTKITGLVRRRAAEKELYLKPVEPEEGVVDQSGIDTNSDLEPEIETDCFEKFASWIRGSK